MVLLEPCLLRQKWSNHALPSKGSINGGSHEEIWSLSASMKPYSLRQKWSNHALPSKGSINGGSHEEIWSLSASMKPYSLRQKWSNHASPSKGSINAGAHEIMRHLHPLFGGVGMPHFLFDPLWPQRPPKGASEAIMGWKNNEACRFLSGPPNNGGYLLSFASFWDRQNCEVIKT